MKLQIIHELKRSVLFYLGIFCMVIGSTFLLLFIFPFDENVKIIVLGAVLFWISIYFAEQNIRNVDK